MPPTSQSILEAGEIYRRSGAISQARLRPEIYRAWERSHLQGANPHLLKAEQLSSLQTERLLEHHQDFISAAQPYCRLLSQAAGNERHAIMLGDATGIVLDVIGDEQSVRGPEAVPGPGSLLSEAVAGSNGIGTPLAEASYAEIVTAEHFIEGFHPFTCQGIPMRNDQHEIIGALSVSVRRPDVGQKLKEILLCASHGVEAELLHRRLEADVQRVLAASPADYQPLEDLRQDLVQAHHASRLRLEVVSRFAASDRFDSALQLLQQAEASIQLFRRRAELWCDLASLEVGPPRSLSLVATVQDLLKLLSTEITIRKVEVVFKFHEDLMITVDPKRWARLLLRAFLQAFEAAGKGGMVEVDLDRVSARVTEAASVRLRLRPLPGINSAIATPQPLTLTVPFFTDSL